MGRLSLKRFRIEREGRESLLVDVVEVDVMDMIGGAQAVDIPDVGQTGSHREAGVRSLAPVRERACRWLLLTQDRAGSDRFQLTQEFLAEMLGVTRQSVTIVAGTLQRAGMITYKRGEISVLNRVGLEEAACECYGEIQRFYRETVKIETVQSP